MIGLDPDGKTDINWFADIGDKPYYTQASKIEPDGFFSVGAHGNPDYLLQHERNDAGLPLVGKNKAPIFDDVDFKNVAGSIRNDSRYKANPMPVILMACKSGAGDNPIAQQVAIDLKQIVIAPENNFYMDKNNDGKYYTGPLAGKVLNKWRVFLPEGMEMSSLEMKSMIDRVIKAGK